MLAANGLPQPLARATTACTRTFCPIPLRARAGVLHLRVYIIRARVRVRSTRIARARAR